MHLTDSDNQRICNSLNYDISLPMFLALPYYSHSSARVFIVAFYIQLRVMQNMLTSKRAYTQMTQGGEGGGWVVLPIMAYMGRLRPKGVPFSLFRYIKG